MVFQYIIFCLLLFFTKRNCDLSRKITQLDIASSFNNAELHACYPVFPDFFYIIINHYAFKDCFFIYIHIKCVYFIASFFH